MIRDSLRRSDRWRLCMRKKYLVQLTDSQVAELQEVIKASDKGRQLVRRANILWAANTNGPNWTDKRIALAYHCSIEAVEKIRRRFVERGFEGTLKRKVGKRAGRPKEVSGRQEAEIIALRLGEPPRGFANWTLRLLAEKAVELEIVDSISHEQVRRTLKKRLHSEKD